MTFRSPWAWSVCGVPPGASHTQGSYQDRSFPMHPPASILLLFLAGKTALVEVLRVLFLRGKWTTSVHTSDKIIVRRRPGPRDFLGKVTR